MLANGYGGEKTPVHFNLSISWHMTIRKVEEGVNIKCRQFLEEVK